MMMNQYSPMTQKTPSVRPVIAFKPSKIAVKPLISGRERRSIKRVVPNVPSAAAAAAAAEPVWQLTGVALVDELAEFATIHQSGLHAVKLIGLSLAAVYIGSIVLNAIADRVKPVEDEGKSGFKPVTALIASATKPFSSLLPAYAAVYWTTIGGALVQVFATKSHEQFKTLCFGQSKSVLTAVKYATQFAQDISEILLIVGITLTAINLKNRIIAYIQNAFLGGVASQNGLNRLMRSFAGLIDYAIYAAALFAGLSALGINVTPLLASLGGASVVIGLASQTILSNIASAVTLYASPPFAAGDAVKFLADGALVVEGTVLAIEPMRTILKTNEGSTLYISNASVVNWMVQNDSQKAA